MSIDNPLWVDVMILVLAFVFSALSLAYTRTGKRWLHYLRLGVLWVDTRFQVWAAKRRLKKNPPPAPMSPAMTALAEMYRLHYVTRVNEMAKRKAVNYSTIQKAAPFDSADFDVHR
jgi:hypothetical protein